MVIDIQDGFAILIKGTSNRGLLFAQDPSSSEAAATAAAAKGILSVLTPCVLLKLSSAHTERRVLCLAKMQGHCVVKAF